MSAPDTTYHEDSTCGACKGPLESWRDAICETCFSADDEWALFANADAAMQKVRCPNCEGEGYLTLGPIPCRRCDGSGYDLAALRAVDAVRSATGEGE